MDKKSGKEGGRNRRAVKTRPAFAITAAAVLSAAVGAFLINGIGKGAEGDAGGGSEAVSEAEASWASEAEEHPLSPAKEEGGPGGTGEPGPVPDETQGMTSGEEAARRNRLDEFDVRNEEAHDTVVIYLDDTLADPLPAEKVRLREAFMAYLKENDRHGYTQVDDLREVFYDGMHFIAVHESGPWFAYDVIGDGPDYDFAYLGLTEEEIGSIFESIPFLHGAP